MIERHTTAIPGPMRCGLSLHSFIETPQRSRIVLRPHGRLTTSQPAIFCECCERRCGLLAHHTPPIQRKLLTHSNPHLQKGSIELAHCASAAETGLGSTRRRCSGCSVYWL